MKNFLFVLIYCILIFKTYGQSSKYNYGRVVIEITKAKKTANNNIVVEIKSFSGLDSALILKLKKIICDSNRIVRGVKKGKYEVTAKFIVSKDGTLSDIICENDPGFGICEDVVKFLKKSPKWTPAVKVEPFH